MQQFTSNSCTVFSLATVVSALTVDCVNKCTFLRTVGNLDRTYPRIITNSMQRNNVRFLPGTAIFVDMWFVDSQGDQGMGFNLHVTHMTNRSLSQVLNAQNYLNKNMSVV